MQSTEGARVERALGLEIVKKTYESAEELEALEKLKRIKGMVRNESPGSDGHKFYLKNQQEKSVEGIGIQVEYDRFTTACTEQKKVEDAKSSFCNILAFRQTKNDLQKAVNEVVIHLSRVQRGLLRDREDLNDDESSQQGTELAVAVPGGLLQEQEDSNDDGASQRGAVNIEQTGRLSQFLANFFYVPQPQRHGSSIISEIRQYVRLVLRYREAPALEGQNSDRNATQLVSELKDLLTQEEGDTPSELRSALDQLPEIEAVNGEQATRIISMSAEKVRRITTKVVELGQEISKAESLIMELLRREAHGLAVQMQTSILSEFGDQEKIAEKTLRAILKQSSDIQLPELLTVTGERFPDERDDEAKAKKLAKIREWFGVGKQDEGPPQPYILSNTEVEVMVIGVEHACYSNEESRQRSHIVMRYADRYVSFCAPREYTAGWRAQFNSPSADFYYYAKRGQGETPYTENTFTVYSMLFNRDVVEVLDRAIPTRTEIDPGSLAVCPVPVFYKPERNQGSAMAVNHWSPLVQNALEVSLWSNKIETFKSKKAELFQISQLLQSFARVVMVLRGRIAGLEDATRNHRHVEAISSIVQGLVTEVQDSLAGHSDRLRAIIDIRTLVETVRAETVLDDILPDQVGAITKAAEMIERATKREIDDEVEGLQVLVKNLKELLNKETCSEADEFTRLPFYVFYCACFLSDIRLWPTASEKSGNQRVWKRGHNCTSYQVELLNQLGITTDLSFHNGRMRLVLELCNFLLMATLCYFAILLRHKSMEDLRTPTKISSLAMVAMFKMISLSVQLAYILPKHNVHSGRGGTSILKSIKKRIQTSFIHCAGYLSSCYYRKDFQYAKLDVTRNLLTWLTSISFLSNLFIVFANIIILSIKKEDFIHSILDVRLSDFTFEKVHWYMWSLIFLTFSQSGLYALNFFRGMARCDSFMPPQSLGKILDRLSMTSNHIIDKQVIKYSVDPENPPLPSQCLVAGTRAFTEVVTQKLLDYKTDERKSDDALGGSQSDDSASETGSSNDFRTPRGSRSEDIDGIEAGELREGSENEEGDVERMSRTGVYL